MPVIAQSPPLVFGATPAPVRTPRPVGVTPAPVRTPRPVTTPAPAAVPAGASDFVLRHEQFILRVDGVGTCFKREELSDFTDQEFLDHSQVAMQDKYLAQEEDMYCSTAGVNALSKALNRLGT